MIRNNIKLLTEDQRIALKNKFDFVLKDNSIIVVVKNYMRSTSHPFGQTFSINARKIRKVSFTTQAQEYWKKLIEMKAEENLIDVQHALNILYVTYQDQNFENLKRVIDSFGKIQTRKGEN